MVESAAPAPNTASRVRQMWWQVAGRGRRVPCSVNSFVNQVPHRLNEGLLIGHHLQQPAARLSDSPETSHAPTQAKVLNSRRGTGAERRDCLARAVPRRKRACLPPMPLAQHQRNDKKRISFERHSEFSDAQCGHGLHPDFLSAHAAKGRGQLGRARHT